MISSGYTYVTPRLYVAEEDVPTWNYAAVQVRELYRHALDPAENRRVLERTVEHFERTIGTGWRMDEISARMADAYARGTASFYLKVTSIEAVSKMSQDKKRADAEAVVADIEGRIDGEHQAIAACMHRVTLSRGRYQGRD